MPAPSFTASLPRSSKSRFPKSETHVACPEDSDERWHIFASLVLPSLSVGEKSLSSNHACTYSQLSR